MTDRSYAVPIRNYTLGSPQALLRAPGIQYEDIGRDVRLTRCARRWRGGPVKRGGKGRVVGTVIEIPFGGGAAWVMVRPSMWKNVLGASLARMALVNRARVHSSDSSAPVYTRRRKP